MNRQRKLFCELSPLTYRLSRFRCIMMRNLKDMARKSRFAYQRSSDRLPIVVYRHNSLIRRKLGNTRLDLQENKAVNLSIAAPKVTGILIRPGDTFSFWRLVGADNARNGYKTGLTIAGGKPSEGIGGGLCQFTNLIHWMVLHSELTIVEHHHHDGVDLFPDYKRTIPFGTGTSIVYNYLDYRFTNHTNRTYQLIVWTDGTHLRGELRADSHQPHSYHIRSVDERFVEEDGVVYRKGRVVREIIDKTTGLRISNDVIRVNHARVMYDTSGLDVVNEPSD